MRKTYSGLFLRLAKPEDDELPEIVNWVRSEHHANYLFVNPLEPYNQTMAMVKHWFVLNAQPTPRELLLVARNKKSNQAVGMLRYSRIDWVTRHADVHLNVVDQNLIKVGIGAELTAMAALYAFEVLNLQGLYGLTYGHNRNAPELFGIASEPQGVLRKHIYINGDYQDLAIGYIQRERFAQVTREHPMFVRYYKKLQETAEPTF